MSTFVEKRFPTKLSFFRRESKAIQRILMVCMCYVIKAKFICFVLYYLVLYLDYSLIIPSVTAKWMAYRSTSFKCFATDFLNIFSRALLLIDDHNKWHICNNFKHYQAAFRCTWTCKTKRLSMIIYLDWID